VEALPRGGGGTVQVSMQPRRKLRHGCSYGPLVDALPRPCLRTCIPDSFLHVRQENHTKMKKAISLQNSVKDVFRLGGMRKKKGTTASLSIRAGLGRRESPSLVFSRPASGSVDTACCVTGSVTARFFFASLQLSLSQI
jgi:hypothetical protein